MGHWRWEEVRVDVGTVACVVQHVWTHLSCHRAVHGVCQYT